MKRDYRLLSYKSGWGSKRYIDFILQASFVKLARVE
jgi:hypothetical protein